MYYPLVSEYFKANKISLTEVTSATGIPQSTLSNVFGGRYNLSPKNVLALSKTYGFCVEYLTHCTGPLFPEADDLNDGMLHQGGPHYGTSGACSGYDMQQKARPGITVELATLKAENSRLKDEVTWLRDQLKEQMRANRLQQNQC